MTIERQDPNSFDCYVFIIVPDFKNRYIKNLSINFDGQFKSVVFGAELCQETKIEYQSQQLFEQFTFNNEMGKFTQTSRFKFLLELTCEPGSVFIFKKSMVQLQELNHKLIEKRDALKQEISKMDLIQLKQFCAQDENEDKEYGVAKFIFQGITPTINGFDGIRDCILRTNNSSVVAANIRQGNWLVDSITDRNRKLQLTLLEFEQILLQIKYSIPIAFQPLAMFNTFKLEDQLIDETLSEKFGWKYDPIRTKLLRAGLLLVGFKPNQANVDQLKWLTDENKADIKIQVENSLKLQQNEQTVEQVNERLQQYLNISVSAGYPHFFDGMYRSWGRDIALSITGILTNQFQLASRCMLVSSAALLRHGLLPNLQDSGRVPRYNCRDAVWFWMSSVVQYCQKYGPSILQDKIKRIFISDEEVDYKFDTSKLQYVPNTEVCEKYNGQTTQTIIEVINEVIEKHLSGIHFTEWICPDSNMKPEGHNIDISIDEQGFVKGGNQFNCHTWMDKMGSDEKFGNKGVPATPRCDAAVEINLCALFSLGYLKEHLKSEKVDQWHEKLLKNIMQFKICFDNVTFLKDTLSIFEFRPNYLIGLSFFDKQFLQQFRTEILQAFNSLLEPSSIGMKTLSPADKNYCPWYNNNDQTSYQTSRGFSYHNGPEWVHCMGRSLICLKKINETALYNKYMRNIRRFVCNGAYINGGVQSLPELTQNDNGFCTDSCVSQAWAIAAVLEAMNVEEE
ncbi:Glycogen_debranching enzyme [Hexamita inflata]|uniref:Glycogen_debranching enzyme n=1 Tax=Hexamita inflata TaxID=28002 RepID=A0ABP1HA84_9EUKA